MKYLKIFEDFKYNNITSDDIVNCIKNNGILYADIINNFPDNDPNDELIPVSVDNDTVTVEFNGNNYEVNIKNVKKIEW